MMAPVASSLMICINIMHSLMTMTVVAMRRVKSMTLALNTAMWTTTKKKKKKMWTGSGYILCVKQRYVNPIRLIGTVTTFLSPSPIAALSWKAQEGAESSWSIEVPVYLRSYLIDHCMARYHWSRIEQWNRPIYSVCVDDILALVFVLFLAWSRRDMECKFLYSISIVVVQRKCLSHLSQPFPVL